MSEPTREKMDAGYKASMDFVARAKAYVIAKRHDQANAPFPGYSRIARGLDEAILALYDIMGIDAMPPLIDFDAAVAKYSEEYRKRQ